MRLHRADTRTRPWIGLLVATAMALSANTPALCGDVRSELDVVGLGEVGLADAPPWDAFGTTGAPGAFSHQARTARIAVASGDRAVFTRSIDPEVTASMLCTFNLALSDLGEAGSSAMVFRLGSGYSASIGDASDASTFASLAVDAIGTAGFRLRDLSSGRVSLVFQGTQAISWALNRSGREVTYDAPDGRTELLADRRMDVWVGRTKVFDDAGVPALGRAITDLKWSASHPGVTTLGQFAIGSLAASTDRAAVAAEAGASEATAAPPTHIPTIELYRPTPNPFDGDMRYAYAIATGEAAVDIGVFDVAGRRVRSLVRATQGAGNYEIQWDGRGDDGIRVRSGVYFLRASLGSTQRVSRVVRMLD